MADLSQLILPVKDASTGNVDMQTFNLKGGGSMPDDPTYKSKMLDFCYPIGSIYTSTNNVSPATFLGGTWISLSGYVLRGATSSVTANRNQNDGGADSVTVSSVASHTHTQDAHTHTQNAHTHTQNAHTHTQNPHSHVIKARILNGMNASSSDYYGATFAKEKGTEVSIAGNKTLGVTDTCTAIDQTATNQNTTATNQNTTATNQNTTATNKNNGASYTINTLPKYKNVYMWERTA